MTMESLNIKGDKKSPEITFEPYSGLLKMQGKSNLENPSKFYLDIVEWLEKYSLEAAVKTTFRMEMEYFNSSSAKHLLKVFRILENLKLDTNKQVVVEWCYDGNDHSMLESGEDYSTMVKIDFIFIEL